MKRLVPLVVALLVSVAVPAAAQGKQDKVPVPTVTGPVTGGKGTPTIVGTAFDLAEVGYRGDEYFIEGEARSFVPEVTPLTPDGKWAVEESDTAPYKTRILVYRPEKAKDFDGTVFVEWLNVSAGFDTGPDWGSAHTQIVEAGAAWVGVSAQAAGVQGGAATVAGVPAGGLKAGDPERYGTLSHPGDQFSYDMFSQAGVIATGAGELDALDGLKAKRVIALGESQSASRMVSYINAIHPIAQVFDGFLVHSRGAASSTLGPPVPQGTPPPDIPTTVAIRRTDVPVLVLQTETDVGRVIAVAGTTRQPDSKRFRLWEAAGTAHADAYTGVFGFSDTGDGTAERKLLDPAEVSGGPLNCAQPINNGPGFAVLSAAVFHLEQWVRDGTAPPKAPLIATTEGTPPTITRDELGIAEGGIRTPIVDVPIAAVTGLTNPGGTFCTLFGVTTPFDAATLSSLYPSHADYVKKFDASADTAVKAGFLLDIHAENYKRAASELPIPQ